MPPPACFPPGSSVKPELRAELVDPAYLQTGRVNELAGSTPCTSEFRQYFNELRVPQLSLRLHLTAPVARRYSGGKDIGAACGMLAGSGVQ